MFTGIIEEIGVIKDFKKNASNASITVECKKVIEDIKLGDSISINGVCQTVTSFDKSSFSAQISAETLNITTFPSLKAGEAVNLERALTLSQRLGGHIVSGHIDGLGKLKTIKKLADFYNITFELTKDLTKYVVNKGSIAVNGISLTVADIKDNEFAIAIIPHTFENTSLKNLKSGDFVNIEVDVLAKYVEKILSTDNNRSRLGLPTQQHENSKINSNFLIENGFF